MNLFFQRIRTATMLAMVVMSVPQLAHAQATDRLIVKYRSTSAAYLKPSFQTMAPLHAIANRAGLQLRFLRTTHNKAHVVGLDRFSDTQTLKALAAFMKTAMPDEIEYVELDLLAQPAMTPNDPGFLTQWNLSGSMFGIGAAAAWDLSTGAGVRVAVIDTGYRPHADLNANLVGGYDFISDATNSRDGNGRDASALDPGNWRIANECPYFPTAQNSDWHGTAVAGLVAAIANNGIYYAGVAFGARVVPIRALGRCGGYTSDIADAIVWAAGLPVYGAPQNLHPAKVINLSIGAFDNCGETYQSAISSARANGSLVVAAAGNYSPAGVNFVTAPANCVGALAVTATNEVGGRLSVSNFGNLVAISAPGGESIPVLSTTGTTTPGVDSYRYARGTSFSAPQVAGAAALALARNPNLDPDGLEWLLRTTAKPFPAACSGCGAGILDASGVAARAVQPIPFSIRLIPTAWSDWEIKNVSSLPLTLLSFDLLLQSSNAWGSATGVTCTVGSTIPPGGVCVFNTTASRCGSGEVYRVAVTNNAGVTQSRESLPVMDESCGS